MRFRLEMCCPGARRWGGGWRARAGFLCHRWLLQDLRGNKAGKGAVDSKIGVEMRDIGDRIPQKAGCGLRFFDAAIQKDAIST